MSVTRRWRISIDLQRIYTVNALHPLGQLIQSVEDSKGWTLREVARRIERSGRTMSHAYVARLKREPIRSITYDTIHALSVGLELPERIVAASALESMGVHDIGTAETGAAVAIARDPDLSERDRKILLAVVREMQSEHPIDTTPGGERGTPAPKDPAAAGGSAVAYPAQPDGVTTAASARVSGTSRGVPGAGEFVQDLDRSDADRPWEQDEYGLAAKRGRNRGREARQQQDRDAEGGGA